MDGSNSGEFVYQAVVPGSASGTYYIPVSNLDPSLSYSGLRALARKVANVEKCFVYPNRREGWIRVRGYENFEKIYKLLNGYKYNGTVISASGQNENNSVYVWDIRKSPHAVGSTCSYLSVGTGVAAGGGGLGSFPRYTDGHSSFEGGDGSGGGTGGAADMGYYTMPASGSSPSMNYGGAYYSGYGGASASIATSDATYPSSNGSSSVASSGYPRPTFSSASSAEGSAVMGMASCGSGGINGAAPWYTPYSAEGVDDATKYATQPYYYYEPPSSSVAAEDMAAAMVPAPKSLKVFVKNLSRHASRRELETFLTEAAGGQHKLQEEVRFPCSSTSSNSSSRRHAFLLFKDHSDALAALGRLHNSKLKGLAVEARFANETVLPLVGSGTLTTTSSPVLPGRSKSHNLVVDGSSDYGRAKRAEAARNQSKHLK
ncbi:hypothetical protein F503_00114 [Ophiostoma piceae UAMH 11346]|uniref:RRM domain-containing protein n=1 Tax=Ophiostoma piceae (strain UAMH 11346) TaxID=1262450 RepID=S3CVY7_OPHP1|nr:hypothetical protein F503_00114 [Ophiostoma piceae UAMH 11346]